MFGCNKNLSEEEKKALWDKAQTQGEIINRSGTPFNLATDPDLAISDTQNRLRTGGGLLGNKANFSFMDGNEKNSNQTVGLGMPINPYLWKASLDTLSFMPLSLNSFITEPINKPLELTTGIFTYTFLPHVFIL